MSKIKKLSHFLYFLFALTFSLTLSFAVGGFALAQEGGIPENIEPSQALECFDSYPYGQLEISTQLDKNVYSPGETATLQFNAINTNANTPLNNAKIIFQTRKLLEESNTTLVLSEKVIAENLVYKSFEKKENSISFTIPDSLPSGLYYGHIYVTDNNYAISGLPFTQDVSGAVVGFFINNPSNIEFNLPYMEEHKAEITYTKFNTSEKVTLSVNPFLPPKSLAPVDLPADITVPIYNPQNNEVQINISSNLYYWDENDEFISSKEQKLIIDPNSVGMLSFAIPQDIRPGTYMLRTILDYENHQIISKIRFSIIGFAPRVYYSGITKNKEGNKEIFTCIGNTAPIGSLPGDEGYTADGKAKLVLSNSRTEKEVDILEFEGNLYDFEPKGYQKTITSDEPKYVSLKTTIYDKYGNLIQEDDIIYTTDSNSMLIVYIVIISIIAITIFLFIRKHSGVDIISNNTGININTIILLLFLIIAIASPSLFGGLDKFESKLNSLQEKAYAATYGGSASNIYFAFLDYRWSINPNVKVMWKLYTNQSVDFVSNSSSFFPGFTYDVTKINNGSWYEVGSSYGTPNFSFSKTQQSTQNTILQSGLGAPYYNPSTNVSITFPYVDTWTTSDSRVSCQNTSSVTGAQCTIRADFPGGNVNITLTRSITVSANNMSASPTMCPTIGCNEYGISNAWFLGGDTALQTSNITLKQTKTINIKAPTGTLSASPNPCAISGGQSSCSTNVTWNTQNLFQPACLYKIQGLQTTETLVGCSSNPTGTINVPGVGLNSSLTFKLYSNSSKSILLDTEKVTSISPKILTVTKSGSGSGTVTGTGISCGSDCGQSITNGTSVALTPSPATGSKFVNWTGCDGITALGGSLPRCNVSMNATKTVNAQFDKISTYSCAPSADPTDSNLCPGDDTGLTSPTSKAVVSACTSNRKCEYTCKPGNVKQGNNCVPTQPSCNLTSAMWSKTSAKEGDIVTLTVNGTAACNGNTTSFVVQEDDFGTDDPVNINPSPKTFSGGKAINTWVAEWQPDFGTDPEYYFTATVSGKNITSNLLSVTKFVPPTYSCAPSADPTDSNLCPGDDTGLTSPTSKAVVSACTSNRKCEYTCKPGNVKQGNNCVPTQCNDNIDNDKNGCKDLEDSGCDNINDNNESGGSCVGGKPQCSDGEDNDGDGVSDIKDPDCHVGGSYNPNNNVESGSIGGFSCKKIPFNTIPSCTGDYTGLSADTESTVVTTCGAPKCEYTCNSGYIKQGNNCVPTQCNDNIDNDKNGCKDLEDSGCDNINDNNESGGSCVGGKPQCSDDDDNDGDGVENELDSGCWVKISGSCQFDPGRNETDLRQQCDNCFDDDEDGLIDTNDPGCWTDSTDPGTYNPTDNREFNLKVKEI